MNFDFNTGENDFLARIDEVMQKIGEEGEIENADEKKMGNLLSQTLLQLATNGYLQTGMKTDPAAGRGLPALMAAMATVAHRSPSLFLGIEMSTRVFGRALDKWANEAQKQKWLQPLIKGKLIGAVGLSEKSMNVENDPLITEAVGNKDEIIIQGEKIYVVNASVADCIAVVGRWENQAGIFCVEKDAPGLVLGERLMTMGYEGAMLSAIRLENCRIPVDHFIGPLEEKALLGTLRLWENQVLIGASLGLMKSALETAKNYAKTHQSGGKPIIAYQAVGFKLAEMFTLFQTAQWLAYRTAWTAEVKPKEAESLVWSAKVFCTQAAEKVAGDAMQVLSGAGYVRGNAAERAFRCAKYGQIAGTSTEIARVKIGDAALGYN